MFFHCGKLQQCAATTLRDIAKYATDSVKGHLPDLLDVYKQIMSEGTHLDSSEICDFVWAICEIFYAIPVEQVCEAMNLLMEQPLKGLQKGIEQVTLSEPLFFFSFLQTRKFAKALL